MYLKIKKNFICTGYNYHEKPINRKKPMRKLLLFQFFLPICLFAQITEDFSDGDLTHDPYWYGDLGQFKLSSSSTIPEDQRPALQLDAMVAGISSLSFDNHLTGDLEWHFWIKLSLNTSSGNFARVYLLSDAMDLKAPLDGYFLQIGGTEDSVIFFRQDSLQLIRLLCLDSLFTGNSVNAMRLRVLRSAGGNWKFFADLAGGHSLEPIGETNDLFFPGGEFFGIYCQYTSSNVSKFYFDDFYSGPFIIDSIAPVLLDGSAVSQAEIQLTFSEPIDQQSAENPSNYEILPDLGNPYDAIRLPDPSGVQLFFDREMESGITYELNISNIEDLEGNKTGLITCPVSYYLLKQFDVIINEILFNPLGDGVDFVELYNRCDNVIDLKGLLIASVKESLTGSPDTQSVSITSSGFELLPEKYLVLTADPQKVMDQYSVTDPACYLALSSFPAFNNDKGFVLLMDKDKQLIDGFHYSEDMHFLMLNSYDGVSLERICPDRPGDDPSNWHSAAETVGFATPGYENSQYLEIWDDGNTLSVQPEIFSPDGDGQDDQLGIVYDFSSPGKLITVLIFNAEGRLVKKLVNNEMPGTHGLYSWDGTLDDRSLAQNGIYIIYMEALGMDGNTRRFKKAAVLAKFR